MKNKPGVVLYSSFRGAALGTFGVAFSGLGHNRMAVSAIMLCAGVAFFVASEIVFRKYNLGKITTSNMTNPTMINFAIRYPLLARVLPMAIGVCAMVICLRLLDKF